MSELMATLVIGLIGSIITGIFAVVGQKIIADKKNTELYAKMDHQSQIADQRLDAKIEKYQAVTDNKIEELTREVRKHNGFAESIPVMQEQLKVANHRIDDLEKKTG